MTELIVSKRDTTPQQILRAAARQFGVMPYLTRAAFNLRESVGRFDGLQTRRWTTGWVLLLALPGFANPDHLPYLTGFVRRRSALAIKNVGPLGTDKL